MEPPPDGGCRVVACRGVSCRVVVSCRGVACRVVSKRPLKEEFIRIVSEVCGAAPNRCVSTPGMASSSSSTEAEAMEISSCGCAGLFIVIATQSRLLAGVGQPGGRAGV